MRHRRRGRQLGRTSPHRKAMLRNMASSLFLTERNEFANEIHGNTPRVPRRIVTTIHKAKEVRSIVEKCITLARKVQPCYDQAKELLPQAVDADDKRSDAYKTWRKSDEWQQWAEARAPIVNAQRKALQMLGNREAVDILFNDIVPSLIEENPDRVSGFTRILKIAKPRLGDNGTRAILEIVGSSNNRDTSGSTAPQAPVVEDDDSQEDSPAGESVDSEANQDSADSADSAEESAEDTSSDSANESADDDSAEEAADSDDADQASSEESEVAEASDDAEEAEAEAEATDDTEEEEADGETE